VHAGCQNDVFEDNCAVAGNHTRGDRRCAIEQNDFARDARQRGGDPHRALDGAGVPGRAGSAVGVVAAVGAGAALGGASEGAERVRAELRGRRERGGEGPCRRWRRPAHGRGGVHPAVTKTLGLFPHVHVVFVDGVWVEADDGRAEFREAAPPDDEMVFEVGRRVFTRLERFLKREGYLDPTEIATVDVRRGACDVNFD